MFWKEVKLMTFVSFFVGHGCGQRAHEDGSVLKSATEPSVAIIRAGFSWLQAKLAGLTLGYNGQTS